MTSLVQSWVPMGKRRMPYMVEVYQDATILAYQVQGKVPSESVKEVETIQLPRSKQ